MCPWGRHTYCKTIIAPDAPESLKRKGYACLRQMRLEPPFFRSKFGTNPPNYTSS